MVLSGGVGYPSSTQVLGNALATSVSEALPDAAIVDVIEVRELGEAIARATFLGLPEPQLDSALRMVEGADVLIATSPVFRGSYAGMFKAFIDLLDPVAMRSVLVVLGATGGSARHQLVIDQALRPLFAYFGSLIVPTGVYATSEELGTVGRLPAALERRIQRAGQQTAALLA